MTQASSSCREAWELEQGVEYAGAYEDKPAVLKRASEPDP